MTTLREVKFTVVGRPATKGSYKAMHGKFRPDNKNLDNWQGRVAQAAIAAWGSGPSEGPIGVYAIYRRRRPKSHFRANGMLKDNVPRYPSVIPDGDKMERALWDGLTGIVFVDDKQVCGWSGAKRYSEHDGIDVALHELEEAL